jgi:hypothetical protein
VNALGDDQNAIDLQRRLIARLNSVDDASDLGNFVAVGGADIGGSGQLNGLKNVGLTVSFQKRHCIEFDYNVRAEKP